MRPRNPVSGWVPVVLLAAIVAIALLAESSPGWGELRESTRRRALASSSFGSRDLTRVLSRLDTVHALPDPEAANTGDRRAAFDPGVFDPSFGLDEMPVERLATVLGIDQEWIDLGVPTVSLLLDPADLAELESNLLERGRDWERPAHFAWVEDGTVRFASRVGCRIHGGAARRDGERYGYRIYFRRSYGEPALPTEIFPTGNETPAKRVVLRRDRGPGRGSRTSYFANAMAHEIAARIGLPRVHSQPAVVFVNGVFQDVRGVIERLDRHWLLARYGHDDLLMARTKVNRDEVEGPVRLGPSEPYQEFVDWALSDAPLTLEEVEARVDVDNLIRWTLLVQLLGTRDFMQGLAVLDLADPAGRWHWVPWDLNISLAATTRGPRNPSRFDQVHPYLVLPHSWRRDSRLALVGRLLASSETFRVDFSTVLDEIYNHRLTHPWHRALLKRYEGIAESFGRDTTFLRHRRRFLDQRPEAVRDQMRRHLGFGATHPVRVDVPPGLVVEIDGFGYERPWEGLYTEGSRLRLRVPSTAGSEVTAWQVGDRRFEGTSIDLTVDAPLTARPILSADPNSMAVEGR